MSAAVLVLGLALAGCVYAYAGYPALLLLIGRFRDRPVARAEIEPSVSVIIAAHDEEDVIERKLRDTIALQYPAGKLEIIVASDGSADATNDLVRRRVDPFGDHGPRVLLLELPRVGKLAALNRAVRSARGEILVFTDANISIDPDALRILVRGFADPAVGGVCGEKRVRTTAAGDATGEGEGLYWRYESRLKRLESRVGSVYAADGALYAIRRRLYRPIEKLAQADDIAISARVVLAGHRLLYEPRAVCWEDAAPDGPNELLRKIRVANHTLRATLDLHPRLWRSPLYALQLLSHKVGRYLVPVCLIAALAANAVLAADHRGWTALLAVQAAFYLLAAAGSALRSARAGRLRMLSVPYYFCLVNAAALLALVQVVRGRPHVVWVPRRGAG